MNESFVMNVSSECWGNLRLIFINGECIRNAISISLRWYINTGHKSNSTQLSYYIFNFLPLIFICHRPVVFYRVRFFVRWFSKTETDIATARRASDTYNRRHDILAQNTGYRQTFIYAPTRVHIYIRTVSRYTCMQICACE